MLLYNKIYRCNDLCRANVISLSCQLSDQLSDQLMTRGKNSLFVRGHACRRSPLQGATLQSLMTDGEGGIMKDELETSGMTREYQSRGNCGEAWMWAQLSRGFGSWSKDE
jgi:hypothetical protein